MTEKEYTDLYNKEWKNSVKYCERILGREYQRDAEDCAQEVFMAMWKKKDNINTPSEWLYGALKIQCKKLIELAMPEELIGDNTKLERLLDIQAGR